MFEALSLGLLAVFVTNIALGASGNAQFLSDVGEMIVLFAASICFVAVILRKEAQAKVAQANQNTDQ